MRKLWIVAGFSLVLTATLPSHAESTGDAMRKFGISGSWSGNCTGPLRLKYSTPSSGTPTVTRSWGGKVDLLYEVKEASRLSEKKLKLLVLIKTQKIQSPSPLMKGLPQPGEVWEIVYVKVGNKFQIFSTEQKDGDKLSVRDGFQFIPKDDGQGGFSMENSGVRMPPLEKCLS